MKQTPPPPRKGQRGSRSPFNMNKENIKLSDIRKLAESFAKARGQEGRRVSAKDMQRALEIIQNKNKKFMNSR